MNLPNPTRSHKCADCGKELATTDPKKPVWWIQLKNNIYCKKHYEKRKPSTNRIQRLSTQKKNSRLLRIKNGKDKDRFIPARFRRGTSILGVASNGEGGVGLEIIR